MPQRKTSTVLEMRTRGVTSGRWKKFEPVYFLPPADSVEKAKRILEKLRELYDFQPEFVQFYFDKQPL